MRKTMNPSILTNYIVVMICLLILSSCKFENKSSKKDVILVDNEIVNKKVTKDKEINYRIPSPLDLFMIVKNQNKIFLSDKLSSVDNNANYNTTLSKALNFGIYSSDLAYCCVFGNFQESLNYFKTTKELAESLGLYEGFGKEMANRVQNNLSNVDSLIELSADSYSQSTEFLSNQGLSDIMALIMTGCWIESIYLATNSIETFEKETILTERVADQQLLLDNLIELIVKIKENSLLDLDKILNHLLDLQEKYDRLYNNDDNTFITKEQYVEISNSVQVVRNAFTQTN